jgi:hypothetical protein
MGWSSRTLQGMINSTEPGREHTEAGNAPSGIGRDNVNPQRPGGGTSASPPPAPASANPNRPKPPAGPNGLVGTEYTWPSVTQGPPPDRASRPRAKR